MRNYRKNAATEGRLDYGMELVAGLQLFPETEALAPDFEQLQGELEQAHEARRALRKPLVKARVGLRLASYLTDQAIRTCSRAAEVADGNRRGPIHEIVFPRGLTPVVVPVGARQVPPTEKLIERLSTSKHPGVAALAAEQKPKLDAALAQLQAAAAAHLAARKAHDAAFQEEVALRDEHRRHIDRLMGHVRAAFPGDRTRQDLVFPEVDEDSAPDAPEGSDTPQGQ